MVLLLAALLINATSNVDANAATLLPATAGSNPDAHAGKPTLLPGTSPRLLVTDASAAPLLTANSIVVAPGAVTRLSAVSIGNVLDERAAMTLTSTPAHQSTPVVESRSAALTPVETAQLDKPKPHFSLGLTLSAPLIGLFAELVGATIALQTVSPLLSGALALPLRTVRMLVLPAGLLAAGVLAAASAVGIHGWLKRPDIDMPLRTMWLCGAASMAIATLAGILAGFATGDPVIGMLYGLSAAAVGGPIIQTVVATRGAVFRF